MTTSGLQKKKRVGSLDIIRIVAIALVFMLHALENTWGISPEQMSSYSVLARVVVIAFYNIGRISVLLFLFLTGYLMLGRKYDKNEIVDFYKTKVLRLVIASIVWTIGYYFLYSALGRIDFSLGNLVRYMFFVGEGTVASHLWYMPTIIGIYLFIPFVSNVLQDIKGKTIKIILPILIGYLFILPTVNNLLLALDKVPLVNNLWLWYSGGFYGVIMILGWIARRYKLNEKLKAWSSKIIYAAGIVSMAILIAYHYFIVCICHHAYGTWYDSLWLLIAGFALFIFMLRRFNNARKSRLRTVVAQAIFGIYLVHMAFIDIFKYLTPANIFGSNSIYFVIILTFTIACTVLFTLLMLLLKRYFPKIVVNLGF